MLVIKNADLYGPERKGFKDILIEGGRIVRVADRIDDYDSAPDAQVLDFEGRRTVPGYIDVHEHITGGGGEMGPASRCPEAPVSALLANGITTCIGLLGTDGISRSLENLLVKAKALCEEGVTCYILSGSYGYPSKTFSGSVEKDVMLIDQVAGVKTAASDHRSSNITGEELIRLGTEVRRGALLAGKGGVVTIHMGDGPARLSPVFYALEHSDLPARTFLPTHMGRTWELTHEALRLMRMGGYVDYTAATTYDENQKAADRLLMALDAGEDQVTLSSDAFGSCPRFNEKRECVGLTYSRPSGIHELLRILVLERGVRLERALKVVTANPARLYCFTSKGRLASGMDADIIAYDEEMRISTVLSKGCLAVKDGVKVVKGRFED